MEKSRGIARRIEFYRIEAGLSAADLARALNVSAAAVSHWEKDGPGPKLANIRRIAEVCGVPVSRLIDEAGA